MGQLQCSNKTVKLLLALTSVWILLCVTACQQEQRTGKSDIARVSVKDAGGILAFTRLTGMYWQIWTMDLQTGSLNQVTRSLCDKRYPVWSRNGRSLFYRTNNNTLFKVDLQTAREERLLPALELCGGIIPRPSGDDYLIFRYKSQLRDSADLWLTDMEGQNRKLLTGGTSLNYDPAWSADGQQIAYISSSGYRSSELYLINADGENRQRMTNNKAIEVLPAFSPGNQTIAFVSDRTGDFEIWTMDTDGANAVQLTDVEGMDTRPCWSPDGNQILFASNRMGIFQLWIMDQDGSNQRQLTDGNASMDPAWYKEANDEN